MKVLFLGPDSGTSRHRFEAFQRLGHETILVDPRRLLPRSSLIDRVEWKVHPAPLSAWVRRRLAARLRSEEFDLAFVDGGSLIGPGIVRDLKERCARVVNFNHDDPFGPRDGVRFASYRQAVPFYDLVVVVRRENVGEAEALGARRVLRTNMVADEIMHSPRPISEAIQRKWGSDVAFVGTWMPERGPFLLHLLQMGVPVSIFGSGWHKAPEWPLLRAALRSDHLEGDQYCYAIQCAKLCLGLLSKGNRDAHTTRSIEIPYLGAVLCAQRTPEHEDLYEDGKEAIFWSNAVECAAHCLDLIGNARRRREIAQRGRERCMNNGHFTGRLLTRILDECSS
jgi:hypothetical protein